MSRRQLLLTIAALSVVLLAGIGGATWYLARRTEQLARSLVTKKEETIDLGTVVSRVRELNRLETASMRISTTSTIKQQYDLVPNGLAGDELTFQAEGDVIAGVDLSLLHAQDVRREPDGTIVMRLPPSQLLVSRIDNRASHVVNRRTGVFRRADPGMESRARQYAEQNIRLEAVRRGILDLAQRNAEARIAGLLHATGVQRVRFEAAPAAPQAR